MTEKAVLDALSYVEDPDLKKDLVTLGMIRDLKLEGENVFFTLMLTTPACPMKDMLKKACITAIHKMVNPNVKVNICLDATKPKIDVGSKSLNHIQSMIAVYSAKGGVGKSIVAANLALSLAASGAKVGLLDADIYGPSIPVLFDINEPQMEFKQAGGKNRMIPIHKFGVYIMSLGFVTQKSQAIAWRGPMASTAIKQLIYDVEWPTLDYLIIDMPPGTGDIHLTIMQSLKLSGSVVVTTPHVMAIEDTRRAISMMLLEAINVPIIGLVENMSYLTLGGDEAQKHYIFGKQGGKHLAQEFGLILLGEVPMIQMKEGTGVQNKSLLFMLDDVNSLAKEAFQKFSDKTVRILSMRQASIQQPDIQDRL